MWFARIVRSEKVYYSFINWLMGMSGSVKLDIKLGVKLVKFNLSCAAIAYGYL